MIHTLLGVATIHNWPLWQMDIKNAFLHGDLHEIACIQLSLGYTYPPNHVCRLKKSLYGLKQAPRALFDKFQSAILGAHFYQSPNDSSLFIR